MLSETERGLVAGILMSEGSFGGDGKQPQIMLRKHIRHESLMRWLVERFPRSRLYGPYHHADRSYYQWVARGPALVEDVLPVLDELIVPELDAHAAARLADLHERYGAYIARVRAPFGRRMNVDRRLAELGGRYALPDGAPGALGRLLELLRADPTAPTALRDPAAAVNAHVADALVALELDAVRDAARIADLGSGAGFPGLVLAAALPDAEVALVEANGRKCAFLARAADAMGLANVAGRRRARRVLAGRLRRHATS